ncbi:hypothetical protein B0H14DRAFT_1048929 [Mycena olivaceomarginata]|nr:hypothetical protein B0H14DRAFT_1048929 [Mycena olivaceomarginata]
MYISPKLYQYIWLPATFLLLGLAPYNLYLLVVEPTTSFLDAVPNLIFFVLMLGSLSLRVVLLGLLINGIYFMDDVYYTFRNTSSVFAALGLVAYAVLSSFRHFSVWIAVHVFYDALMCVVERRIGGDGFQVFMMDKIIIQCLQFLVAEDSISFNTEESSYLRRPPLWSRLISVLRRQPTGPIALPPDDDTPLEMDPGAGSASRHFEDSPWIAPAELTETLTDWSRLSTAWHTYKALWITADSRDTRNGVAREAIQLFSSADFGNGLSNVALIDKRDRTGSAFDTHSALPRCSFSHPPDERESR